LTIDRNVEVGIDLHKVSGHPRHTLDHLASVLIDRFRVLHGKDIRRPLLNHTVLDVHKEHAIRHREGFLGINSDSIAGLKENAQRHRDGQQCTAFEPEFTVGKLERHGVFCWAF
jgi:hypothetical protein